VRKECRLEVFREQGAEEDVWASTNKVTGVMEKIT
jgi:hypothetical protein